MKHEVINNKPKGISVMIFVLAMTTATFFMADQNLLQPVGY